MEKGEVVFIADQLGMSKIPLLYIAESLPLDKVANGQVLYHKRDTF